MRGCTRRGSQRGRFSDTSSQPTSSLFFFFFPLLPLAAATAVSCSSTYRLSSLIFLPFCRSLFIIIIIIVVVVVIVVTQKLLPPSVDGLLRVIDEVFFNFSADPRDPRVPMCSMCLKKEGRSRTCRDSSSVMHNTYIPDQKGRRTHKREDEDCCQAQIANKPSKQKTKRSKQVKGTFCERAHA